MALVDIQNASLGYESRAVLSDISLSVQSGDYLCIVGANGSGKSTLMKTMLGLLPPIRGRVALGDGLRKNEIGYLPQQTEVQKDFPAAVEEIVLSGCLNRCGLRPFFNREEKALAHSHMERLGIAGLARMCYRNLSGGQQQRVLLARALCATRKMLLLDEPVAGLDPQASEDMYRIIAQLNQEDGITIVMISHDIEAALAYAGQILHIGAASTFYGSKDAYLASGLGGSANALGGGDGA